MQVIHRAIDLNNALKARIEIGSKGIGFVPTMGNLHAGHIKLVEIAKQHADCVVVSIFVNPLQFGKNEDFGAYPRTLAEDCDKLQHVGADYVFAPSVEEMYPDFDGTQLNQTMSITPPPIADALCGASRPGHFSGVATVVLKLFNIVQPDVAVFGKKDFQQLHIIRELVRQFNLPIEIIAGDTVREESGLAMSSRNGYLSAAEHQEAPRLYKALRQASMEISRGQDISEVERQTAQYLAQMGWVVDYIAVRSSATLLPALEGERELVALGAARLGKTRLIDNVEFLR